MSCDVVKSPRFSAPTKGSTTEGKKLLRNRRINDENTSDVIIKYHDDETSVDPVRTWYAHREILTASSGYFARCLDSDSRFQESENMTICLRDVHGGEDVVNCVLEYMYSQLWNPDDVSPLWSITQSVQIYFFADYLDIGDPRLLSFAEKRLRSLADLRLYYEGKSPSLIHELPSLIDVLYCSDYQDHRAIRRFKHHVRSALIARTSEFQGDIVRKRGTVWDLVNSCAAFGADVSYALAEVLRGSQRAERHERYQYSRIWRRMTALQRLPFEEISWEGGKRGSNILDYQRVPIAGQTEYLCPNEDCAGYFTHEDISIHRYPNVPFADSLTHEDILAAERVHVSCPWCQKTYAGVTWAKNKASDVSKLVRPHFRG